MACLIMGSVEFEQPELVTFSGDDPNLCLTLAAIMHRAHEHMNHFVSSRVVIFGASLLPEDNVSHLFQVCRRLHQAAVLHKFLHKHVNFTLDFFWLQFGIFSGGPPSYFTVFVESSVLALLARRLVSLVLDIRF